MSDSLLFLLGVVGSLDDQPRQHRPQPVRNLESELAPFRGLGPRCTDCGFSRPKAGEWLCGPCERERQLRKKTALAKRSGHNQRAESIVEQRIADGGWAVATANNRHIIERLIQQGRARWMTPAEQQRHGLQRFDAVATAVPANKG
jgi:hypothetical protein